MRGYSECCGFFFFLSSPDQSQSWAGKRCWTLCSPALARSKITLQFSCCVYFINIQQMTTSSNGRWRPTRLALQRGPKSLAATDLRCLSPAFLISAASALSRKVTSTDPGDRYIDRQLVWPIFHGGRILQQPLQQNSHVTGVSFHQLRAAGETHRPWVMCPLSPLSVLSIAQQSFTTYHFFSVAFPSFLFVTMVRIISSPRSPHPPCIRFSLYHSGHHS